MLPTVSIAPAHFPEFNGLDIASRSSLDIILVAPRSFRYSSSSILPVTAVTEYPNLLNNIIDKLPTPPAAPVTTMSPLEFLIPEFSSSIMDNIAVNPAVPTDIVCFREILSGFLIIQSLLTRTIWE